LASLARYRRALGDFVRSLPLWLEGNGSDAAAETARQLKAIDGGRQ
jgi:hypothetical protein